MNQYELYCGKCHYTVSKDVQNELDSLMYWIFEKKMAEHDGDRDGIRQANDTIKTIMDKMEYMGVPNWVGNGAIAFAETHDLRECSARDFFTKSIYAKPPKEDIER